MNRKIIVLTFVMVWIVTLFGCNEAKEISDQVSNVVYAEDENVLGVKNGTNSNYPGVTYGNAFESFFSMPTWKYFEGTRDGETADIVEFTGYCTYQDVEVKALIQFMLNEDGTFQAEFLSFNEVPQNALILAALLEKVFESVKIDKSIVDDFITGKGTFVDYETNLIATVFTLPEINNNFIGNPAMYAVTDLDGDGVDELLIEYDGFGDTAILDIQDGKCTAYYISYRGITGLKKDGTMIWSNSAYESGVQRMHFSDIYGIESVDTIVYNTEENIYLLDGINVAKEVCENALKMQHEKENVEWVKIQ